MKKQYQNREYKDPVCGMKVSQITATDELEYKGKTIYFCASICKEAFEAEPEKYILQHRQHGLKPR